MDKVYCGSSQDTLGLTGLQLQYTEDTVEDVSHPGISDGVDVALDTNT